MKKLFSIIFCVFSAYSSSWQALLEQHHYLIDPQAYQLLIAQQESYAAGNAPTIADPRIKQIPIRESAEDIINLMHANHARITVMSNAQAEAAYENPKDIDPRAEKHACMRRSVFNALERMVHELDTLAPHFGYAQGELEIKLFEGLRDLATQKAIFDARFIQMQQENPKLSHDELYALTCTWVSPYINNIPVHSTGAAIDIHLYSTKRQGYCDMGPFNVPGTQTPTFSENLTLAQKRNRLLLLIAATQAGLTNYVYEFWHFSYSDRYAAYWRQQDCALYSAV